MCPKRSGKDTHHISVFNFELHWAHGPIHAHECNCHLTLAHTDSAIVGDDAGVAVGLVASEVFSTRLISLIPFAFSTIRCQIPRFTCVVSRNTILFGLLCASARVPSHRRTTSRSINLSLISFVIQQRSVIHTAFSTMCFWAALNRIARIHLVHHHFSVLTLMRYLAFNSIDEGCKIASPQIPSQSFFSLVVQLEV